MFVSKSLQEVKFFSHENKVRATLFNCVYNLFCFDFFFRLSMSNFVKNFITWKQFAKKFCHYSSVVQNTSFDVKRNTNLRNLCIQIIGQFTIILLPNDQLESICRYYLLFSFTCASFKKVQRFKKNNVIQISMNSKILKKYPIWTSGFNFTDDAATKRHVTLTAFAHWRHRSRRLTRIRRLTNRLYHKHATRKQSSRPKLFSLSKFELLNLSKLDTTQISHY